MIRSFLLVLFAFVSLWATCTSGSYNNVVSFGYKSCSYGGGYANGDPCNNPCNEVLTACGGCPSVAQSGNLYYTSLKQKSECVNSGVGCTTGNINDACSYAVRCATQAEADSVNCALNPTDSGCVVCADTTYTMCRNEYIVELGSGGYWAAVEYQVTMHACSDGTGEAVAERRGSELPNVDCRENPFGQNSSSSSYDSLQCVGNIGNRCIMRVGSQSETFNCPCDNGCKEALQPNSSCYNMADSILKARSSASSSPSSSPSSSGSSSGSGASSSSGSGESSGSAESSGSSPPVGDSSDWEYDYSVVLEAIRNATEATAVYSGEQINQLSGLRSDMAQYSQTEAEKSDSLRSAIEAIGDSISSLKDTSGTGEALSKIDSIRNYLDSLNEARKSDSGYVDVELDEDVLVVDTSTSKSKVNSALGLSEVAPTGCYSINFDLFGGQLLGGRSGTSYSKDSLKFNLCAIKVGSVTFNVMDFLRRLFAAALGLFTIALWIYAFKNAFGAVGD